jgi:FAD dependent oxidoreductase TIGR03364
MTTREQLARQYDLAVVGGGIIGLAHAYLAARKGLKVVVIERDGAATGASVRNFGFITITGQQRGDFYQLALRSRELWQGVIERFSLPVQHEGLYMCVRRPEAEAVLEAFMQTEMAEGCRLLTPSEVAVPLQSGVSRVLHSRHEIRLESREVIPQLCAALQEHYGVGFLPFCTALDVLPGKVVTSLGVVTAAHIAVCQGDSLSGVFSSRLPQYGVTRCKLQMLRLESPGYTLPGALMSDLGLVRYLGYSELPEAAALKARLQNEQPQHLAAGVHLIVVQSSDGSLVVGDTHVYGDVLDPFTTSAMDALVLDEFAQVLGNPPQITERWMGTYASSDQQLYFIDQPDAAIRHVVVTCGAGASTAFAIAERSLASMGI